MTNTEKSAGSYINKRSGDAAEPTLSDWDLLCETVKAGERGEALGFLEQIQAESQANNDNMTSFVEMVLAHLAGLDEEEVLNIFRQRYYPRMKNILSVNRSTEETMQYCTGLQKRHHAEFTVTEEQNRYVVRYDPCGTGGRLRRTRRVGTTKKAYPWSWGKTDIPYYCCHCCVNWEMIATELRGYPLRITLIGDKPEDPCVHLFYKKPELIPEEYFTRIGMEKDMARIKATTFSE